jgi:hypothetical protein
MKILKKGGASPKMLKEERDEHKAEGFKSGGKVKKYANGSPEGVEASDEGPEFQVTPEMMEKSKAELSASSEKEPAPESQAEKPKFTSFKDAYAYYKKPQNGGQGSIFDWQGKKIKVQDAVTPKEVKPASSTFDQGKKILVKDKATPTESTSSVKTEPVKLESAPKSTYNRVPTPEEAAANRQAIYDKVKSMGQSVSDYYNNFETPAERSSRERKEKTAKMASGGMVNSYKAKSHGKC